MGAAVEVAGTASCCSESTVGFAVRMKVCGYKPNQSMTMTQTAIIAISRADRSGIRRPGEVFEVAPEGRPAARGCRMDAGLASARLSATERATSGVRRPWKTR